jgi:hypothetical protein
MSDLSFISLIPSLTKAGEGHDYNYNQSVRRAAAINGWVYSAAIPVTIKDDDTPKEWTKCLPSHKLLFKKDFRSRATRIILSILSARRFIRKNYSSGRSIIFIESFDPTFLLVTIITLSLIHRKQIRVWLLYRNDQSCKGVKGLLYKYFTKLIKILVKPKHFKLLSDSRLLVDWFSSFFGETVYLVPIPHTDFLHLQDSSKKPAGIIAWMPGRQMDKPYNKRIANRLSRLVYRSSRGFLLVLSEKSRVRPMKSGPDIQLLPDVLPQEEYSKWMQKSDLVLLPYDPVSYCRRTSGVFVETVCAGKTPVVTDKTWMAEELRSFDLGELLVDWYDPNILLLLEHITTDPDIKSKILRMQNTYFAFHNEKNFASSMKALFKSEFMLDS